VPLLPVPPTPIPALAHFCCVCLAHPAPIYLPPCRCCALPTLHPHPRRTLRAAPRGRAPHAFPHTPCPADPMLLNDAAHTRAVGRIGRLPALPVLFPLPAGYAALLQEVTDPGGVRATTLPAMFCTHTGTAFATSVLSPFFGICYLYLYHLFHPAGTATRSSSPTGPSPPGTTSPASSCFPALPTTCTAHTQPWPTYLPCACGHRI